MYIYISIVQHMKHRVSLVIIQCEHNNIVYTIQYGMLPQQQLLSKCALYTIKYFCTAWLWVLWFLVAVFLCYLLVQTGKICIYVCVCVQHTRTILNYDMIAQTSNGKCRLCLLCIDPELLDRLIISAPRCVNVIYAALLNKIVYRAIVLYIV